MTLSTSSPPPPRARAVVAHAEGASRDRKCRFRAREGSVRHHELASTRFRGCGPGGLSGAFPTLIKPACLRGVAHAEGASRDRKCRFRAWERPVRHQDFASTRFRGCGPGGLSGAFPTLIKPVRLRGVARAEWASWVRKCRFRAREGPVRHQDFASTRSRKTAL